MKFKEKIKNNETDEILDVRRPTEFLSHHIVGADNFPLDYINSNMKRLKKNKVYHIHCAGGYRSMIAASILQARGYRNIVDIQKGFKGIEEMGEIPLTNYLCPSKMTQEEIDKAVASVI